jgi:hypothetical protein
MDSGGERGADTRLAFASIVFPGESTETNAILLAESIHSFAGSLSENSIKFYTPGDGAGLSEAFRERLSGLGGALVPFVMDDELLGFPFMTHAFAAARAEEDAMGQTDVLAWLSPNTLVLREPRDFLLGEGVSLGFRPVHHTLIGSRFDEPLDSFWSLIYELCGVPEERVFPMETHVDGATLRPYFNSGILVARPGRGLMEAWRDKYVEVYDEPALREFYGQNGRYRVFVHQAVLSGVILSELGTDEVLELPPSYNYPLHLHGEDVTDGRPVAMEELVTMRHEGFYSDPLWFERMPAGDTLKRWLVDRLALWKDGSTGPR